MRDRLLRAVLAAGLSLGAGAALAQAGDAERGASFVREACAECHAVERSGDSPLPAAPPLRDLHKLYPVETLEEALAEGIVTAHADMPQFELEPEGIADLIAYLKSLE